jgi:hypothetical protein
VRLQVLSTKIQDEITAEASEVSDEDAEAFYEQNKVQFEQPASRNIRIVLNKDQAKAQQAFDQLSADNSPESWNTVAKELSTDATSKDKGGVREAVTEGVFAEPLNADIFDAPEGEVQGPVETPEGFYVFQVDTATEATTASLDDEQTRAAVDDQITTTQQQAIFTEFLTDYRDYWTERTTCADGFEFNRCNGAGPELQPCDLEEQEEAQAQVPAEQRTEPSCPAPVFSTGTGQGPVPVAPGTFDPFVPVEGSAQRPHPAGEDVAPDPAAGAIPGSIPGAPTGAPPGATPGAAGTAPPPQ